MKRLGLWEWMILGGAALALVCGMSFGQNAAVLVLRSGTTAATYRITEGQSLTFTVPLGPDAPNGPQPLYLSLSKGKLAGRNGGHCDPYNQGGKGQPLYLGWLAGSFPGRSIFGAQFVGARNTAGDDWTLISPDDPVSPCRKALLADPAYAGTATVPFLDGGEGFEYELVEDSDPFELGQAPDAARWAQVRALFQLDESLFATEPMAAKMADVFRWDSTCSDTSLPRAQTLEGWMLYPENLAKVGTGGPGAIRAGFYGPDLFRTWCTGGIPTAPDGTGWLKPWYEAETHWWIFAARHWDDPDPVLRAAARQSYKIACDLTRKAINTHLIRMDAAYALKDAWRNEGNEWSGPNQAPRPMYQIHKAGTGAGTPYSAKYWDGKAFAAALARRDDPTFVDAADRRIEFWRNVDVRVLFGPGGESRMFGNSLRNLKLAKNYCVLIGDPRAAMLRAKAEAIIEHAYQLSHTAAYQVDWFTATTDPARTPFNQPVTSGGISAHGEGALLSMATWIVDEGTNPTRLDWLKRMTDYALRYLTRPAGGKSTDGLPMREWAYYFRPDPANWNGPPLVASYNGGLATTHHIQLEAYCQEWWPGVWTQHFAEMRRFAYRNPGYTPANSGAITTGSFNYTSWGKWEKDLCIGAWLKRRGAPRRRRRAA